MGRNPVEIGKWRCYFLKMVGETESDWKYQKAIKIEKLCKKMVRYKNAMEKKQLKLIN